LKGTPRTLKGLIRSLIFIARANGYTKCGPYLLASSLAAALLDGPFEHPAWCAHRVFPQWARGREGKDRISGNPIAAFKDLRYPLI